MEPKAIACMADISNLPTECIKLICKYLSLSDTLNACVAMPSWEVVLYSRYPRSYITTWHWMSEQDLVCLCSDSEPSSSDRLRRAIKCHFEEMKLEMRSPVVRAPRGTFETVKCLFLISILAYTKRPFRTLCRAMQDPLFFKDPPPLAKQLRTHRSVEVKAMSSDELTSLELNVLHLQRYKKALSLDLTVDNKINLCSRTYQESIRRDKEALNLYDCILYIVEVSRLSQQADKVRAELTAVCEILSPEQTFALFVMADDAKPEVNVVEHCSYCFRQLGGVHDCPLLRLPMKWRMWFAGEMAIEDDNNMELFEWVCRDVIKRRIEKLRSQQQETEHPL